MWMRSRVKTVLLFILLTSGVATVDAFQFTPLSQEIVLNQVRPSSNFTVENTTSEPIAVQIRAFTREITLDGSEVNNPASDLLQIYPSQIILQPGDIQVVRVRWTGSVELQKGQAFRIIAEQLPINLKRDQADTGSTLRILLRYSATLFVEPVDAYPEIVLVSAESVEGERDRYRLVIRNDGTGYARLNTGSITLVRGGLSREISWLDIPEVAENTIPPGVSRSFIIEGLGFLPYSARITTGK